MVILAAVFAGVLLNGAFAPFNLWFVAPASLAWLLILLSSRNFATRLKVLFAFGFAFYLPLLSWSNTYVGNIPWILLVTSQTLFLIPLAFIQWSKSRLGLYAIFPSLWIFIEWAQAHFPFGGFGWGRIGFSQVDSPYAQLARLGGVPLLSFYVAWISVTILWLYFGALQGGKLRIVGKITGGVLAGIVLLSLLLPHPHSFAKISLLAVQGGVPRTGLNFNSRAEAVFKMHQSATYSYLLAHNDRPEVIIWPENSVDVDPFINVDISSSLTKLTSTYGVPLIFGAVTNVGGKDFNESILWIPHSGVESRYIKQHLTPFGEYIPLRPLAEAISPHAKMVFDFTRGTFNVMHHVGNATISPIICYELLDDALGRAMNQRSNLIVVQTNSATFGSRWESIQQLNITRIRAIEHQKYVASVATTGISAFIDPTGRILEKTSQNQRVALVQKLGLNDQVSISDRYGSILEMTLIALFLPVLWLGRYRR